MDELGRIVLPIELIRTLGIDEQDPLELFVDQENIILKKYDSAIAMKATASGTLTSIIV